MPMEWNEIWSELTVPGRKIQGFKDLVGDLTNTTGLVQVPLNFWFCRNPGLALPLIALQYHETKLFFTFGSRITNKTYIFYNSNSKCIL